MKIWCDCFAREDCQHRASQYIMQFVGPGYHLGHFAGQLGMCIHGRVDAGRLCAHFPKKA